MTAPLILAQGKRYRHFRSWILILFVLLFFTVDSAQAGEWVTVKWVDDGDTVLTVDGRRIRYIGINTPEIDHPDAGRQAEPFAYEARAYNIRLVYRQRIRLEFDAEKKDRYDRRLAYVFLADGRFVNLALLEAGLAYVLPRHPNQKYAARFLKAQRSAMAAGRGIWRQLDRKESSLYWGNRRSKRFHSAACPFARKISDANRLAFSSQWAAFQAGYAPAKECVGSPGWGR